MTAVALAETGNQAMEYFRFVWALLPKLSP
jgi:hypothetical protein